LFVAAFSPVPDSGAAGSLFAIAAALEGLGHHVDLVWEPAEPFRFPPGAARCLFEVPRLQWRQAAASLSQAAYDVVIISQPFGYLAVERLSSRHPRTLFLNRTHGWEARLYEAQARLGFGPAQSAGAGWPRQVSAALHRRACRRMAHACHAVIAPASLCAEYIRSTYHLPPERVPIIPYGADAAGGPPRRVARNHGRGLLFVGSYLPRKGSRILETLLPSIAREFADVTLTFVTQAASHRLLEDRYRSGFGDRLSIHAWRPRGDLQAVYAAHDILLFPSLFEGFGKVWMEAMSAGMCVVGFSEGGLPDVARAGEALTCAPGDAVSLGGLLRHALQDPPRCAEIGRRAQQRVREFTWERNARETVAVCERLRPS
jgi:glycosyltransferase involved in cell wall biosynthesis